MIFPQDIIDAKLTKTDIKNLGSNFRQKYNLNEEYSHEVEQSSLETHEGINGETWQTYATDSSEYRNMLIYAYFYEDFNKADPELIQTFKSNPVAFATLFSIANQLTDDPQFASFSKDFASRQTSAELNVLLGIATAEDKQIIEAQQFMNEIGLGDNITPQEQFSLPDMGDYYLGNVDEVFMEQLDQKVREKRDAQAAAHYAQSPPAQKLGYDKKNGTYFLKCYVQHSSEQDIQDGLLDIEHITVSIDDMSSTEEDTTNALSKLKERVNKNLGDYPLLQKDNEASSLISLKIAGINSELFMSHWCYEENVPKSHLQFKLGITIKEAVNLNALLEVPYGEIIESKDGNISDTVLKQVRDFAYICGRWREVRNVKETNLNGTEVVSFKWILFAADEGIYRNIYYDPDTILDNIHYSDSYKAALALAKVIQQYGNVIYVNIDESGLSEGSKTFTSFSKGTWNNLTYQAQLSDFIKNNDSIAYSSYNLIAMERSRRFLSEIYVKEREGVFINVAKLLAQDEEVSELLIFMKQTEATSDEGRRLATAYSTDYEGNNPYCFDMAGYDFNARTYADAFFDVIDQYDDRPQIQQELFGVDWANLQENNVILGDVCFFVPPTNIRMQTYTQSERMDLMRAKGTATKTSPNQHRILAMDIYFNEDRGINGATWATDLPNGLKAVYSLNGLRAVLSMFRFTPYLPITNKFVNKTLGIDAVCLAGLHVQQVSGYPKLIQATITMTEFKWTVYMPDILQLYLDSSQSSLTLAEEEQNLGTVAYWNRSEEEKKAEKKALDEAKEALKKQHIQNLINGVEDNYEEELEKLTKVEEKAIVKEVYKNWFAKTFNWKTFRYYYQRPLIRGELLSFTDLDFNSEEYIQATCGALTSFVPMRFEDPGIKFYMADENYLQQVQKQRYELLRGNTQINFNDNQLELFQAYADVNNSLQEYLQSEEYISNLQKLNDFTGSLLENPPAQYKQGVYPLFDDVTDVLKSEYNSLKNWFFGYSKSCITNDLGFGENGTTMVNTILSGIDAALEPVRTQYPQFFDQDMTYISYLSEESGYVVFGIAINLKEDALGASDLKGFMNNVSALMGVDVFNDRIKDYELVRIFDSEENRIVIPLAIRIRKIEQKDRQLGVASYDEYTAKSNNSLFTIKGDSGAMKFLALSGEYISAFKTANETGGTAETTPDVNALMNLVYQDLEIKNILVVDWNADFSNRFARLRAISSDGDAPQYMGGSDVHLQVTIQTQDEQAAKLLVNIPKEITRLTRTYHHVMPCVPLRINSEFSKFLGVNEVTCENAIIQTNENFPGLYTIQMDFISMDRTIREREAAVRRAANNSGYNYYGKAGFIDWWNADHATLSESVSSLYNTLSDSVDNSTAITAAVGTAGLLIGAVTGFGGLFGAGVAIGLGALGQGGYYLGRAIGSWLNYYDVDENDSFGDGTEISKQYMQFFDLKKALGENDLYPDLELPTIVEMEAVGYEFLRYKFQDERTYVDPDFYFIYPCALQSHVYRELAIHGMESDIADTVLTDSTGACATLKSNPLDNGYTIAQSNDAYKNQQAVSKARRRAVQRLLEQQQHNSEENIKQSQDDPTVSLIPFLNTNMEREAWSISSKISCMFLERRFKREIESYNATERANNVGNTDSTRGTSNAENVAAAEAASEANSDTTVTQVVTSTGDTQTEVYTEGKSVHDRIALVKEDMLEFYKYLSDTSVDQMLADQNISVNKQYTYNISGDELFSYISDYARQFIQHPSVSEFLKALKIDIDDNFTALTGYMIRAAACAATGNKEYSAKHKSGDWKPQNTYIGVTAGLPGDNQIHSLVLKRDDDMAAKIESVVRCGVKFGLLGISMYSDKQIHDILSDSTESFTSTTTVIVPDTYAVERLSPNVNTTMFLLDPHYRKDNTSIVDIEDYKRHCITDIRYCVYAYMRLVMYWLCRLVLRNAIPTITTDVFRSLSRLQLEITEKQKEVTGTGEMLTKTSDGNLMSIQKYVDFYSKGTGQIDAGKIWSAVVLASSDGDKTILKLIDNRDYGALNSIIQSCATVNANIDPKDNPGLIAIRKMVLALVGQQVIDSMSALGVAQTLPANTYSRDEMQKLYLKAAQDPNQYIPHSFHDMVVHDARGRMLRAFPTFYMCFIDEGRQIGFWKLHDNFYNTSSIQEITITKSRKIPADVCEITMSNFYNSYTTEQEDYIKTQVATLDQAWNSIFSPSEYFTDQEVYRRNKPMEIKLRLRQGARIHVRLGYGNNAAMIPPLFNGVITEVDSKEAVHIIAQGDGWELINPIQIDKQAHNLSHSEDWFDSFDNADTPLQHATALFNTMGGVISEVAREQLHLNLGPRNPFGIVHFGDPDFKTFIKSGEACQNLYEAMSKPVFGGNIDVTNDTYDNWTSDEVPQITFDLFQKTPWDVLNICKSISPDFKLAVIPWNFRSTVFMGMPQYYYCYDYVKDVDGTVKEKRKPFEQWHIYSGNNDIIGNGIKATARDMYNVAMGMYTVCESLNIESQETVGPLFADWDIYPESQRTMIVDTSLLGKGPAFIGTITNSLAQRLENNFNLFDDTGAVTNHKKVAWRSTASKLRESVQDMYAGDLVIFGDPSVKPQDRFYMADDYTGITGQALVKEVVYHMSGETGFITTISPDCVAVVDSGSEIIKTAAMERIGGIGVVHTSMIEQLSSALPSLSDPYTWGVIGTGLAAGEATTILTRSAIPSATKFLSKAGSHVGSLLTKVGMRAATGGAIAAFIGSGIGLLAGAATLCSVLVLPYVNAFLEQELKNYKVIQIFPLKKYGYVYTAGFEGARGSVYGSPTWGDRGSLGDVFDAIQDKCPMLGYLGDFLFNDEVKNLAKKYQRDNGIINSDGTSADLQVKYGAFAAHLAGDDFTYQSTNYRSQQLTPRATVDNATTFKATMNYYSMNDTEHYQSDPKLKNNKLISQDSRIKPYITEQFFLIAHEDPGLETGDYSTGDYAQEETLVIDGKKYRTKFIHCSDDNGNPVIDIPLLNQDAINILYEIIRRSKGYMPSANTTDPNENWEITKNSYLVLKSALRIGDQTSAGSTGFTFIISATDDRSQRALKASLESLMAEIKSEEAKALGLQQNIFSYQERENREVAVFVNPPKQQEERNKNTGQEVEE